MENIKYIVSGLSSSLAVVIQPIESLRFYEDDDGVIRMNSNVENFPNLVD